MKKRIFIYGVVLQVMLLCFGVANKVAAQCNNFPTGGTILQDASGTLSIGSISYVNDVFFVQSDLLITGAVDFTDAVLVIDPGVKITVQSTASLAINGCHLLSCSDMWAGIKLESSYVLDPVTSEVIGSNSGTLRIADGHDNSSSIIEDAEIAIEIKDNYKFIPNTSNTFQLSVSNTIFNKNFIGIKIDNYDFIDYSGATPNGQNLFPFYISNCIFTCRNIPLQSNVHFWESITTLKTGVWTTTSLYPNTPNVMSSPYIDDKTYLPTGTDAFLKASSNLNISAGTEKSDIGIWVTNPLGNNRFGYVVLGDPSGNQNDWGTNIFDNLRLGINSTNAYVKVRNSAFQNLVTKSQTAYNAIGVLATNLDENDYFLDVSTPLVSGALITPKNAFFDCHYAIKTEHYQDIFIQNCDVRNNVGGDFTGFNGQYGIDVETWQVKRIEVSSNEIYNIGNGIIYKAIPPVWAAPTSTSVVLPYYEINVLNNIFNFIPLSMSQNGINSHGRQVAIEMVVAGTLPSAGCPSNCSPWDVRCIGNKVNDYYNGIEVAGFENKDCRILNNEIFLRDDPASTGYQFGIRVADCIPKNANNNNSASGFPGNTTLGNFIYKNTIFCSIELV